MNASPGIVRVALCQINTVIGAFETNSEKVFQFLRKAKKHGATLAVFPELTLTSYPPLDLLERRDFLELNSQALKKFDEDIAKYAKEIPETIVLGAVLANPHRQGRPILNTALVYSKGKRIAAVAKKLLPTYDVFDEARYFESGLNFEQKSILTLDSGLKLGISICEDAWYGELHMGRQIYSQDPAIALKGCDLLINISASPFEMNKYLRRIEQVSGFAARVGAPMVYVNQVGANDEILFDGGSFLCDEAGTPLFEMPVFEECLSVVDLHLSKTVQKRSEVVESGFAKTAQLAKDDSKSAEENSLHMLHEALVTGIRDYFQKTGFKKAVLGLSGGIDSAVVAYLATKALGPKNVLGIGLPSQYSSGGSLTDAEALAKNLGVEFRVHSIKFLFSALQMELKSSFQNLPPDVTEENMQSRLRAIILQAFANKRGALTLTTGNKSEIAVGYCTTYGDMAGALAPLGDVYKTIVFKLARYINQISGSAVIPISTLEKPPSAELRPNQKDQDSLPPYEVLDLILESYLEGSSSAIEIKGKFPNADPRVIDKVVQLVDRSEFKRRQAAPALKITSKAFGLGRRIPIAKQGSFL